jgi:hypothetical protein
MDFQAATILLRGWPAIWRGRSSIEVKAFLDDIDQAVWRWKWAGSILEVPASDR